MPVPVHLFMRIIIATRLCCMNVHVPSKVLHLHVVHVHAHAYMYA